MERKESLFSIENLDNSYLTKTISKIIKHSHKVWTS